MTGIMDGMDIMNGTDVTDGTSAGLRFRKSTRCATNACVEVADTPGTVHVRDATGTVVTFGTDAWRRFTTGVRDGTI